MAWTLEAGSQIGPTHISMGKPNQDRYGYVQFDRYTALVVADGAGSLARSDQGAELAVTTVKEQLSEDSELSVEFVHTVIEKTIDRVQEEDDHQLGSTIALVLFNDDEWVAGALGDSFIVVSDEAGNHFLSEPPREYANYTALTTSPDTIYTWEGEYPSAVAVSSDGITRVSTQGREPYMRFWSPVFGKVTHGTIDINKLLRYMGSTWMIDDDSTLVVSVRD